MTQELLQLSSKEFWDQINNRYPGKGGVYRVIAVRDGQRIPINRLLGPDEGGVLYIGKASVFADRVINLKKSIAPGYIGESHHCGLRYKANPNIARLFPYDCLHVDLIQSDNPAELESKMLVEYSYKFGELPPFNAQS